MNFELILITGGGIVLFVVFLAMMLNSFLKKAAPGTALVKTGFGLQKADISTSSAIVIPLLHKVETIDMTVKTVRIKRRERDSLSCEDGIRAEVEVDFYIKINPLDEDIRRVANSVGCERASNYETIRQLFEAKFSDALKTAGAKLSFDQLYQNRKLFKDEILSALGQEGDSDIVLNGYRLDDVAIQYLEQLPLDQHDENNVLDSKGIKEIAQRTSLEAEAANQRLNQRKVTISTQNQDAETRQLNIDQDLALKRAKQKREIEESQSIETSIATKTREEQETLAAQASISRQRSVEIFEQDKQKQIQIAEMEKQRALAVAEEEKQKAMEIAKIQRESAVAEQLKEKLSMLEQTALQEAQKIRAEEQAVTVKAIEIANREKQINVISAEKEAEMAKTAQKVEADIMAYNVLKESQTKLEAAELNLNTAEKQSKIEVIEAEKEAKKELLAHNVEADREAYLLTTIAKAKLEAADLEFQASEKKAASIRQMGEAEAQALLAKIQAENAIGSQKLLADSLEKLIPMLPQIIEKLMLPAEKIDSIKFVNFNGFNGGGSEGMNAGNQLTGGQSPVSQVINALMSVGLAMPLLKDLMSTMKGQEDFSKIIDQIKSLPAGEKLIDYVENFGDTPTVKK